MILPEKSATFRDHASGAGVSPGIAQGRQPPQRIAAIDAVMHEKTPDEGTHDSNPWFLPGGNASRRIGFPSGAAFDLLKRSVPEILYDFTNAAIAS